MKRQPPPTIGIRPTPEVPRGVAVLITAETYTSLKKALGTISDAFATTQLAIMSTAIAPSSGVPTEDEVNSAIALVASVKPRNELEAALAVQIAITHAVSVALTTKVLQSPSPQVLDARTTAATKFQRTLLAQYETMTRMRRGGRQTVVVQHTTVNGGQAAIVGHVRGGGRGRTENQRQAHASQRTRTLDFAPGSPLWSEDALGDAMLCASGVGEVPMPDARGSEGQRGTEG